MDEDSAYDCDTCGDAMRVLRVCHLPLRGSNIVDTRATGAESDCPVSHVTERARQVARATALLDVGAVSAEQIDAWYMGAIERTRASRGRVQRARMKPRK